MQRERVITGNWKMYKTIDEATQFVTTLSSLIPEKEVKVYLAVPFTAIHAAAECAAATNILIGAQNMSDVSEGAFTGEVAARMLKDAGAQFVILGHSERRLFFQETNSFINKKLKRALDENLQPILCIGETLEEKEAGDTESVLKEQLLESLEGLQDSNLVKVIIAYEPIWAIGTGKTASAEVVQNIHAFCRSVIAREWGDDVAQSMTIQYGGSVKPSNAASFMLEPDIDGLLVGSASLDPIVFSQIVNYQN